MKQTINEYDFIEAFRNYGRLQTDETAGNFTREGLRVLFEYLTDLEEGRGEELELDVIALCCDFAEYNEEELIQDYGYMLERGDNQTQGEYIEALIEELYDNTTVLDIDGESWIIGVF